MKTRSQVTPPDIDPEISALLDSISEDSLEASVAALQGFFTRHTNSDTSSATVGIGAARRWVHERFVDISNANGGNLQVGYHNFTVTVSGITKEHRNVVAELPGSDPQAADRILVVSAHLDSRNEDGADSTGYAPGANDDGSGVAAAIELACLAVHEDYRGTGRGDLLLNCVQAQARSMGATLVFVLTTRADHWFRERGFQEAGIDQLPVERRALFNDRRASRVLIKTL